MVRVRWKLELRECVGARDWELRQEWMLVIRDGAEILEQMGLLLST